MQPSPSPERFHTLYLNGDLVPTFPQECADFLSLYRDAETYLTYAISGSLESGILARRLWFAAKTMRQSLLARPANLGEVKPRAYLTCLGAFVCPISDVRFFLSSAGLDGDALRVFVLWSDGTITVTRHRPRRQVAAPVVVPTGSPIAAMAATAGVILAGAARAIGDATAGHEPGTPYAVSRRTLSVMALGTDIPEDDRQSFWAAIASREASRRFEDGWGRCHSILSMQTENGVMEWTYETTSGTVFFARESREDDDTLPLFSITIPIQRDQPGRTAWGQVRLAILGWQELYTYNVDPEDVSPSVLARIALTELLSGGCVCDTEPRNDVLRETVAHYSR